MGISANPQGRETRVTLPAASLISIAERSQRRRATRAISSKCNGTLGFLRDGKTDARSRRHEAFVAANWASRTRRAQFVGQDTLEPLFLSV